MLRNKLITCFRKCTVSYGNVILIIWCLLTQYLSAWSELFYLFKQFQLKSYRYITVLTNIDNSKQLILSYIYIHCKNGLRHLRETFLGLEFSLFLIGSSFNQT